MKYRTTIIMRSKNSDWVIGEALASLFSQNFKDFELLVVDSGSTDKTLDIVSNYPCRLIEIESGDYYPGKVLNDAIAACDSELIVFLNSDSVMLSPDSLGNLIQVFENETVKGAFGRQIPRPDAFSWVKKDYAVSFPENEEAVPDWITLSLPLAAIRRSMFEAHPFYTDAWASEDTEWGHWARENGHEVKYVPSAATMHSHNYTLKEIYGRRFVEGEADVFIYNHPRNLAQHTMECLRSMARDLIHHLKEKDLNGIPNIFPRRVVYHWAYYKGQKLGQNRRVQQNYDTSVGQSIVLNSISN